MPRRAGYSGVSSEELSTTIVGSIMNISSKGSVRCIMLCCVVRCSVVVVVFFIILFLVALIYSVIVLATIVAFVVISIVVVVAIVVIIVIIVAIVVRLGDVLEAALAAAAFPLREVPANRHLLGDGVGVESLLLPAAALSCGARDEGISGALAEEEEHFIPSEWLRTRRDNVVLLRVIVVRQSSQEVVLYVFLINCFAHTP